MPVLSQRHRRSGLFAALVLCACSLEHLDPVLTGLSGPSDDGGDAGVTSLLGGGSTTSGGGGPGSSGDASTTSGDDDSTSSTDGDTSTGAPLAECVPWVRVIDTTDPTQEMRGLAVDGAGNVVIVGEFRGDGVDFGAGPMNSAQGELYVAKYGPDGAGLWSRQFGPGGDALAVYTRDVIFDAAGNVVVVGDQYGGINFGGGLLPASPGGPSTFVVKLGPDGEHVWSRGFAAPVTYAHAESVAADPDGGVVVLLTTEGPLDLGAGPLGGPGLNTLVARLADDGSLVWGRSFTGHGPASNIFWPHAGVTPGGAVVIAGRQEGAVDFGAGVVNIGSTTAVVVARLTADGALEWVEHGMDEGASVMVDVGVDGSGQIHLGGHIYAPFEFGGPLLVPTSGADAAAVLLDGAGGHLWSERYGSGFDRSQGIDALAVNAAGERLVAGQFLGNIDFGGGELGNDKAETDVFVARQGPLGEHRWSRSFGGEGQMFVNGAAIDAAGSAWIGGIHDGELIVGDEVFNSGFTQYQIYVMRMCADDMP